MITEILQFTIQYPIPSTGIALLAIGLLLSLVRHFLDSRLLSKRVRAAEKEVWLASKKAAAEESRVGSLIEAAEAEERKTKAIQDREAAIAESEKIKAEARRSAEAERINSEAAALERKERAMAVQMKRFEEMAKFRQANLLPPLKITVKSKVGVHEDENGDERDLYLWQLDSDDYHDEYLNYDLEDDARNVLVNRFRKWFNLE